MAATFEDEETRFHAGRRIRDIRGGVIDYITANTSHFTLSFDTLALGSVSARTPILPPLLPYFAVVCSSDALRCSYDASLYLAMTKTNLISAEYHSFMTQRQLAAYASSFRPQGLTSLPKDASILAASRRAYLAILKKLSANPRRHITYRECFAFEACCCQPAAMLKRKVLPQEYLCK